MISSLIKDNFKFYNMIRTSHTEENLDCKLLTSRINMPNSAANLKWQLLT